MLTDNGPEIQQQQQQQAIRGQASLPAVGVNPTTSTASTPTGAVGTTSAGSVPSHAQSNAAALLARRSKPRNRDANNLSESDLDADDRIARKILEERMAMTQTNKDGVKLGDANNQQITGNQEKQQVVPAASLAVDENQGQEKEGPKQKYPAPLRRRPNNAQNRDGSASDDDDLEERIAREIIQERLEHRGTEPNPQNQASEQNQTQDDTCIASRMTLASSSTGTGAVPATRVPIPQISNLRPQPTKTTTDLLSSNTDLDSRIALKIVQDRAASCFASFWPSFTTPPMPIIPGFARTYGWNMGPMNANGLLPTHFQFATRMKTERFGA